MNKRQERFFAEQAAHKLNVPWDIGEDRESPDFVVTEGNLTFGLEVSELFTGPMRTSGSIRKTEESIHQDTINRYRKVYEDKTGILLRVQILGTINESTMGELVNRLVRHDFAARKVGEQIRFRFNHNFKAHVTKALRGEWFRVDDRVGFVNTNPLPIIRKAVAKKARNLDRYQLAVGADVRVLLVANRLHSSGKLKLVEEARIDTCGFHAVYFFSYPESVTVFAMETVRH